MPLALVMSTPEIASSSNGARLVTTDGRELPLTGTSLRADCAGGLGRTVVEQRFENPHAEALSVTYSLPLPADGAVSGFAFRVGGRRIAGEVQRRADARAEFERAIVEGRSAALLEQERSSLFTQDLCNIPPGGAIVAEITVDQPLRWLDEGAWEWRFPTVVAPRYLGEPGRVSDAAAVMQDIAEGGIGARFTLACSVRDALPQGRSPESPSHPMRRTQSSAAPSAVTMCIDNGARLDRDVVVRWPVAAPAVGVSLQLARPAAHRPTSSAAYGLLTLVPPLAEGRGSAVTRDLIVLIDTSGSMGGEPLDQARRVVSALVDTLGQGDRLEMIEFSSRPTRWRAEAAAATEGTKAGAFSWLKKLRASGGTEMREGIREALRTLRPGAQRQVILVTDGHIGFETEVIAEICGRLPASSRLHTVGVGSSINRTLTGPAARAGRGVEVIIGLGEDPERAAARLCARTNAPIVVDLAISGSALLEHAPRRLPDLFAGAPALIGLSLREGGGELVVTGRTAAGAWEQRIGVPPTSAASGSDAVVALYGREAIEDRELQVAAGGSRRDLDAEIERLGLDFQLATRLTSWIAVTREITVAPGAPQRRERMPHELPHGMSAEGLGLRASSAMATRELMAGPIGAPSSMLLVSAEVVQSLPRKRSGTGFRAFAFFIALTVAPIVYFFTRSFGIAAAIALGVLFVLLLLGRLFR
jgi:Ca-activated chloride channel homolog